MIQVLKRKFEEKTFITSIGDVRMFYMNYGVEAEPKSRSAARSQIFRYIENELSDAEIQQIIDDEMYSGPSTLQTISDAIRRNGRTNR